MNITVDYIDQSGTQHNRNIKISRLAFAKHLAIAGQGFAPSPSKFIRTLGMFFHYSFYLQKYAFQNDCFSEPPVHLSDPTEKGQFSNLAGKAIADYLSKKIDKSLFTVNYEAEMRLRGMKLNVGRPDLISYSQNSKFAIETKGFAGGPGNMSIHKAQSLTGGIKVNYTVASVAYNLYNKVHCNYHDPYNDNIPYDHTSLRALTRNYYQGLLGFLNDRYFSVYKTDYQGELFYEVNLFPQTLGKWYLEENPYFSNLRYEFFRNFRLALILPERIVDFASEGISNNLEPFIFNDKQEKGNIYIDNDRVGLVIRS